MKIEFKNRIIRISKQLSSIVNEMSSLEDEMDAHDDESNDGIASDSLSDIRYALHLMSDAKSILDSFNFVSNYMETPESERCVHTEHCCAKYGCKYGQEDSCPVWLGYKKQSGGFWDGVSYPKPIPNISKEEFEKRRAEL